jgi:hypothetical protein
MKASNTLRSAATVLAALSILLPSAVLLPPAGAEADSGRAAVPGNECANPVLATDQAGWGPLGDLATTRQAVTDHAEARWEFGVANGTAATVGIYLPQLRVLPGAIWDLSVDARTLDDPARIRMEVDWYSGTGAYLGHVNGGYVPVSGQRAFTRVAGRFTVPAGAARANVLTRATDLAAGSGFASTMCTYQAASVPDVELTAVPGDGTVTINWRTTRTDITGWRVGRDGTDTHGTGPWATDRPADARTHQFNLLRNETPYTFTVTPRTAAGALTPVTVSALPTATPAPGATEAAVLYGWGTPLAQYSDEFDYVGPPAAGKWGQADECWPNPHADGGQRCASATTVDGSKLVMTGSASGKTGWLQNNWSTRYGRWEARVRSRNTATGNGRTYHPLLIVWPDGDRWPDEGEYDFLENTAPGAACAEGWLHYPHPDNVPIQQVKATEQNCGSPLSEWHNIAFEWTADHVRGFVDGREWFKFSGGANSSRRAIQTMASGHLTMQLDNFDGTNMTPASYEADWVRVYPL